MFTIMPANRMRSLARSMATLSSSSVCTAFAPVRQAARLLDRTSGQEAPSSKQGDRLDSRDTFEGVGVGLLVALLGAAPFAAMAQDTRSSIPRAFRLDSMSSRTGFLVRCRPSIRATAAAACLWSSRAARSASSATARVSSRRSSTSAIRSARATSKDCSASPSTRISPRTASSSSITPTTKATSQIERWQSAPTTRIAPIPKAPQRC